ncbi:hypothetical protein PFISCL1PPCAC_6058, partial [Pristionchus fissidentatus]
FKMPPKRTRAKSVKQEVDDDLLSFSHLRERKLDVDKLFALSFHETSIDFGHLMNENLNWIFDSKEELKVICQDFGGAKTVPKTPKRETAFSKIKDTINMFDNLALVQVPQSQSTPLELDNVTEKEDDNEREDEVFEEETQNEHTERDVKSNDSPVAVAKTPIMSKEIKEEVLSERAEARMEEDFDEKEERNNERRGKSRIDDESEESGGRSRRGRSRKAAVSLCTNKDMYVSSRIRMGTKTPTRKAAQSPARDNGRAIAAKKALARGGNNSHNSTNSSPVKAATKNLVKTKEKDELDRAERMRRMEEKGKTAEANREDQIRERAERAKRDREEREMKVRVKKEEDEKKMMMKRMEQMEKEKRAEDLRKRQAQSPARTDRERHAGTRTPTRLRLGNSPEGRLMKRAMNSPLTPRVPIKQHRVHEMKKAIPMMMNESEDDEMEREREAKRLDMERKKRLEEEAMRMKKMKEEEERVARLKEEERRRDEERRRKEKEEREREKKEKERREMEERERKEKEEREREKLKTPILKNKHLANASMNESQNSYDMTPDKIFVPATETNYGVEDLESGDETDDENNPRKKVPKWASQPMLGRTISTMRHSPPFDPDTYFGPIIQPDLNLIFKPSSKYPKRTSSAMWNSPLSNPTKGKSRFFNN